MSAERPGFNPVQRNLGGLLRTDWPLTTDRYQRDFAWEDIEVDTYIDDLKSLVAARTQNPQKLHFFGAIVAIHHDRHEEFDRDMNEIVDGQQRLTMFTLTFAAIAHEVERLVPALPQEARDHAEGAVESMKKLVIQNEVERHGWKKESVRPFQVTSRDLPVYEALLDGADPDSIQTDRESHQLLINAYKRLAERLLRPMLQGDATERMAALESLRNTLERGIQLIVIFSDSREDANQLFAVLNNRGRRLEESDLLRSYTLMLADRADEKVKDQIAAYWDTIDGYPRTQVDAFLRHHYASVVGLRLAAGDVARRYQKDMFGSRDEPVADGEVDEVVRAVRTLSESMALYDPLSRGEWPFDAPDPKDEWIRDRLYRIVRVLGSDRALPLLLSAASRGNRFLTAVVDVLERAEFRAIVTPVNPNTAARFYFDLAAMIRAEMLDEQGVAFELESWMATWAPDERFLAGVSARLVYGTAKQNAYIKHFLTTIADHLPWIDRGRHGSPEHTVTVKWNWGSIEDEHIFPQSPDGGVPDDMKPFVNRLGNQSFWSPSDNKRKEATNRLPTDPVKIDAYNTSEIEMTKRVGKQLETTKKWDPSDIEAREVVLVDYGRSIYALSAAAIAEAATRDQTRTALFEWRQPNRTGIWLAMSKADSAYDDIDGQWYHYKRRIPNGKQIRTGDVLLLFRPQEGTGKKKLPPRCYAVATVARVEVEPSGSRKAIYAEWQVFPNEIDISMHAQGKQLRDNPRNAINTLEEAELTAVLVEAGIDAGRFVPSKRFEDDQRPMA